MLCLLLNVSEAQAARRKAPAARNFRDVTAESEVQAAGLMRAVGRGGDGALTLKIQRCGETRLLNVTPSMTVGCKSAKSLLA